MPISNFSVGEGIVTPIPPREARPRDFTFRLARLAFLICLAGLAGCVSENVGPSGIVSKWDLFEESFHSSRDYDKPLAEAQLRAVLTSPSGHSQVVDGFWDGGRIWKIRFSPDELGTWYYSTTCTDTANSGLHHQEGHFFCAASRSRTVFERHGPVHVSTSGAYFEHEDGTPFLWRAESAGPEPLSPGLEKWREYARDRAEEGITVVEWSALPQVEGGEILKRPFSSYDPARIDPSYFRELDEKVEALSRAGLLSVPAFFGGAPPVGGSNLNSGFRLSEEEAVTLARYMIARWGAYPAAWILAGGEEYRGARAERLKRIGRRVFREDSRTPATVLSPGPLTNSDEFRGERWFSLAAESRVVLYLRAETKVSLKRSILPSAAVIEWANPQTGARTTGSSGAGGAIVELTPPDPSVDWVLTITEK